jgi:hypothetical protein
MTDALLLESGDLLLQEDGDKILIQSRGDIGGATPSISVGDVVRPRVTTGANVPVFVNGGADVGVRILWGDGI